MKFVLVSVLIAIAALRIWTRRRRRQTSPRSSRLWLASIKNDVGLVAVREMRERFRGRIFKVGTVFILVVVAAAIIIPVLHNNSKQPPQKIGVVGTFLTSLRATVESSAKGVGDTLQFVAEPDVQHARADLRSGRIDLAMVNGSQLVIDRPLTATNSSVDSQLVLAVAKNVGFTEAVQAAHLSRTQSQALAAAKALPVRSIQSGKKSSVDSTSLIGVVLIFVMLSQYNTWTLIGVMEEKSSRVIEVLLSAIRPIQLLTGKVLGIGLVALAQASLIVAFALALSKVVGSNLTHGTAPLVLASTLVWLVLGYAFYCWVYAVAGSMAERQDQVQSLALPLSLPMIFGYIMALTQVSSGSPTTLLKILAYLPPTAPFAMPVLVGFGAATWWEFLCSVLISVACTFGVARAAATIYRRSILRTGGRVRIREVLSRAR
jgi:ABC-2 type transport system permease protein